jgi:hypothetical protein
MRMFTIVGQYWGEGAQVQGVRMEEQWIITKRATMMALLSTRVPAQSYLPDCPPLHPIQPIF